MKINLLTLAVAILSFSTINAQPVISGVSPASGNKGIPVTINGTGFSASGNSVYFGSMQAIITSESATSISVYVPDGYGNEKIRVQRGGDSLIGYSPRPFHQTHCSNNLVDYANSNITNNLGTGGERSCTTADFDNDGLLDIAITSRNENKIYFFKNTTSGGLISFATPTAMTISSPIDLCTGDFNGDGAIDIATCSFDNDEISVLMNSNFGSITFYSELNFATGNNPYGILADDIDGDGMTDIVTGNYTDNSLSIFRNLGYFVGAATFATTTFTTGLCCIVHGVETGDLDNDGDVDIAVASRNGGVNVVINNSTPGTISLSSFGNINSVGAETVVIDDYDGDGLLDIASAGQISTDLQIMRNTMSGSLSFAAATTAAGVLSYGSCSADVTGDGLVDIIVPNNVDSQILVFKNTSSVGSISFSPSTIFGGAVLLSSYDASVGDFNNDGGADIVNSPLGGTGMVVYEKKNVINSYYILENVSLCKGSSHTFQDGTTVNNVQSSVTHVSTFTTTTGGCDSIYESTITLDAANLNISQNGSLLTADASGAVYQWVDCGNGYSVISGATYQNYSATVPGDYACIITENSCTDTSICATVSTIGYNELTSEDFIVYPNPSLNTTSIQLPRVLDNVRIELIDISGRTVYSDNYSNVAKVNLDLSSFNTGIYLVNIKIDNLQIQKKLVKR